MGEHRFFLSPEKWPEAAGCSFALDEQEAHHVRVLRLSPGEKVIVLDGKGHRGTCCIQDVKKKSVQLLLEDMQTIPQPLSRPILALALSKAVRRGFFAEKAAELGAAEIWLWQGDCSQGKLAPDAAEAWQNQMIAGIKQCGNPWLPVVRVLRGGMETLVQEAVQVDRRILPWELEDSHSLILPEHLGLPGRTLYTIGPEGGFSERELALMEQAGFLRVSLGARVLRCETAATLCLGLHWWASHLPEHAT